ncbi:MAG: hypothetical protein H0T62_11565 [Parachlamydiaceae bacterium]|nr:hypothetical protein [Parachlamydiaceae bacterium]
MLKQNKKIHFPASRKIQTQSYIYAFPLVLGLEDISVKLNSYPAENIFSALFHAQNLKPIANSKSANKAERMLEYLGRAFEKEVPKQVEYYRHLLCMLLKEYDDVCHTRASESLLPHEFLKALLIEDQLSQKSLVPDCFSTKSQVSEFLHQKKGRQNLNYEQAVSLGKKFKVDPKNFL